MGRRWDPMLARPGRTLPAGRERPGGCRYEPKWDGYREIIVRHDDGCIIWSRNGEDLTTAFAAVVAAA